MCRVWHVRSRRLDLLLVCFIGITPSLFDLLCQAEGNFHLAQHPVKTVEPPGLSLESGSQRSRGKRALSQRECRHAEQLCKLGRLPCAPLREGLAKGASVRQGRSPFFHPRSPPDSHHSDRHHRIPVGFHRGSPSLSALDALRRASYSVIALSTVREAMAGGPGRAELKYVVSLE